MASLAAIFAMGKPVALEARADERDTRGFISMTTMRPSSGFPANWRFTPPRLRPDLADDGDGRVAHHLVLLVGERLGGRHGDGVARVHAHGIDVLDGADDDHVVGEVAHDLELELLPPDHRLLDEHAGDGRLGEAPAHRAL